ncbi:glyoxalase-like domain-containing protein, partial [Macrophomina phaseolina]
LDHIVVLLSYLELLNLPTWIKANFTVSPGGRHADGKTENKLILFQDGTYIELIAFLHDDPANRRGHWWGDKRHGIIDWALTSSTVEHANRAAACLREWKSKQDNEALADFAYTQPRQGGRRKPDGQEIAWFVTFPQGVRRGLAPFWCHDSTPRQLRAPIGPQGLQHQCGAIGISNLIV